MMHCHSASFFTDITQHFSTRFAAIALHLDLDKLVRLEAGVNFLEHVFRQPVIANHDSGVQVVTKRTQVADLFGIELGHMLTFAGSERQAV